MWDAYTSFIGLTTGNSGASVPHQRMASLVAEIHFKLSGMMSTWLRDNIKCNIFLQPCSFDKIVRIMPKVTAMLPHHCKLILSPDTNQRDQMQLSIIFSASTSSAIFWTKNVIEESCQFNGLRKRLVRCKRNFFLRVIHSSLLSSRINPALDRAKQHSFQRPVLDGALRRRKVLSRSDWASEGRPAYRRRMGLGGLNNSTNAECLICYVRVSACFEGER